MVTEHEPSPRAHVAKRMMPHIQRPLPGNQFVLVVHGERVEPTEGSKDQVMVYRPGLGKLLGMGDINNKPAASLQLIRHQGFIDSPVRLPLLLSALQDQGGHGERHCHRRDQEADKSNSRIHDHDRSIPAGGGPPSLPVTFQDPFVAVSRSSNSALSPRAFSGLASGLALDVHPRVAMQILRHSRIAITMEIYTEVPSAATREALRKLGLWLEDTEGLVTWARSEGLEPPTF